MFYLRQVFLYSSTVYKATPPQGAVDIGQGYRVKRAVNLSVEQLTSYPVILESGVSGTFAQNREADHSLAVLGRSVWLFFHLERKPRLCILTGVVFSAWIVTDK